MRDVLRRGRPGRLLHVYGPTETTTYATWQLVEGVADGASTVPIGRPIANTTSYVLDRGLEPVPVGVPGELFLGGDGLARGYLGRPELTAEKFVPDPFSAEGGGRLYRTGDLVRYRPDGAIEFLGRVDHQVKLRGYRIELGEIESVLGQHPGVKDAIVVAREDRPGDKRLVAYVTPRDGHGLEAGELRDHLQARLPEYMVPSAYVAVERLPLNPNGKVDRRALPAPEGPSRPDQALVPPRNDLEREIAAIWRDVLGVGEVGVNENFFDLGGHSLTLLQVHGQLRRKVTDLKVVDLFQYSTISALAAHVSKAEAGDSGLPGLRALSRKESGTDVREEGIAIIGMAGRFPGARDLDEFWRNLSDGVESISFFSAEELEAEGIPAALYREARYVRARGVIEGAELFDASFFGYNAREAEVMDPQQRVFLETAWTALESAGYDAGRYRGRIGVYAGTSLNTYVFNLISNPEVVRSVGGLAALIASDKDFLTTRVSYKLDLRGPSVDVQTACSTSLVAIHFACRSLINHECDIGLAGGVSVGVPRRAGYLYEEAGIFSPDGHCRAFDRGAGGTVGGSGVGIVVLKRLRDALADGDRIEAVIKGSAINNDGDAKVGYTAPGVEGQAEVIAMAQAVAGTEPATIGYVEAHGTGTALGDPIEIQALTQVFGSAGNGRTSCLIGSLKTNIGHLDAAAGVAGLIKTALALKHRQIPPSLHFEEPNPKIDFVNSPFRVNAQLSEWTAEGTPRRAGVSSFGIGGTNAHVVLEEAPPAEPADPARRSFEVLVLSAKTPAALEEATRNLAAHLEMHPELDFADMAYTLQVGRRAFRHRRMVVCRDVTDALGALEVQEPGRLLDGQVDRTGHGVVFLFPGQGAQHANMGLGLYRTEEVFKTEVDRCAEHLRGDLGFDLRDVMYPAEGKEGEASGRLEETAVAQPGLFVVEYAMACLWKSLGVNPEAMLGHSVGEYVAACLAGVFSLEDALSVVAARGRLMQGMAKGSMLAVGLPEPEVVGLLQGALGLAAINGPSQCVVSGPDEEVQSLESRLSGRGVVCQRLRTSHAFHSAMMEPMLSAFRERVSTVERHAPKIPYISNLTGTWVTENEAVDAGYWVRHLRETVRFSEGLSELVKEGPRVLLEVGPGQTLCGLARRHSESGPERVVVASARHARESVPDEQVLVGALGRLWLAGMEVDWTALHAGERRRRVLLPTYPFERQRYWVEASRVVTGVAGSGSDKKQDISEWFYVPAWFRSVPPRVDAAGTSGPGSWLVFTDGCGLGSVMVRGLEEKGHRVISVEAGEGYLRRSEDVYQIDPRRREDYDALVGDLRARGEDPRRVVHLWGLTRNEPMPSEVVGGIERAQDLGFYSLLFLAQALGDVAGGTAVKVVVFTNNVQDVTGTETLHPEKATVLGPCLVIPQEYPSVRCRSIDVELPVSGRWSGIQVEQFLNEVLSDSLDLSVAYRQKGRWVQTFKAVSLEGREGTPSRLREGGVYLITGGLGGVGLELAQYLARMVKAKLVLVGRSVFPEPGEWSRRLESGEDHELEVRRIRKLQAMTDGGAEVLVLQADMGDEGQMRTVVARTLERFGALHGVIHAAGGDKRGRPVSEADRVHCEEQFRPRVRGMMVLERVLRGLPLDFCILHSSLASVLGAVGNVAYTAAHVFMDRFAARQSRAEVVPWIAVNWDNWQTWNTEGMPVPVGTANLMTGPEGVEVFHRLLGLDDVPAMVVSTGDLQSRIDRWVGLSFLKDLEESPTGAISRHPRPVLQNPYVAPRNEVESTLAEIWQGLLGIDQVGVNDNFFELGGDSVVSIQVLARSNAAGLRLTAQQIFERPTIAELAPVAGTSRGEVSDEPAPSGPVGLTPIQHWFFEQAFVDPHHFNQSVLLEVRRPLDPSVLERAVEELIRHHDVLGLRYRRRDDGELEGQAGTAGSVPFTQVDLSACPEADQAHVLEEAASTLQASLHLSDGPLMRAAYFPRGNQRSARLLLIIHHLVVDVVSWRVLIEDLEIACRQVVSGQPVRLPAKTTSFARWTGELTRYARSETVGKEVGYWLSLPWERVVPLPVDLPGGENTTESVKVVATALDADDTRVLLQELPDRFKTQVNEVLLTALAGAIQDWTGASTLLVDLEGHGRESVIEGVDLSRTVGWFTSLFPVLLEVGFESGLLSALKSVKEQYRAIPGKGLGHGLLRYLHGDEAVSRRLGELPKPGLSFLYLGRMDQGRSDGFFAAASEPVGPSQGPREKGLHLLEVVASVTGGRLRVNWVYSENLHHRSTVEALAERFLDSLRAIVRLPAEAEAHTASDFPGARLGQQELEAFFHGERPTQVEDVYELSPLQQGILFHSRAAPDPGVYLITMSYALKGRLDVAAFERAWQRTVDRNPILRTSFHWEDVERPLQVVHRGVLFSCERLDWRGLAPAEQEARLSAFLDGERTRAFPLDLAPLMHLALIHTGDGRYRLIWTFHHILLEGWSASLVLQEVFAHYKGLVRGEEVETAPRPPYRDYILWLQQRDLSRTEAYWRRTLEGFRSPTPLPVTRQPAPGAGQVYGSHRFSLPVSSSAALASLARRNRLTLNTVLQGAWAMVLSRYSGEEDVLFGSVVSGRQAGVKDAESMVGLFVNTLPARVGVRPEAPVLTWLKELQDRQVEMREFEYSSLMQVQGWSDVPRGTRLFESMFAFENWAGDVSLQGLAEGLEVEDARLIEGGTDYPLALEVGAGSQVWGIFIYDRRRFTDATVARLAGHYETLLQGIVADPERRVSELPLLGQVERDRLVVEWNDTARDYPREASLTEVFAAQVRRTPEAVALSFDGQVVTYRELDRRSNQLARYLRTLGVGPEVRVGVSLERSLDLPVALLGIVKAGGAYVPLDPSYPAERLAFMLGDSSVPVLLTQERLVSQLTGHGARVVCLDRDWEEVGKESAEDPGVRVSGESLAYVIYTSGSTGIPKGVAVTHRGVSRLVLNTNYLQVEASDRIAQASNASFDAATFEIWGALLNGARVVGISREVSLSPRDLAAALREQGVTILFLTTALFNQVVQEDAAAFSTLRHLLFGGEAVAPPWVRRVLEGGRRPGRLLHVYGPTETTTFATWHLVQEVAEGAETVPIGGPIGNTTTYVLDEGMGPVPIGVAGELFIGGDGLARGYLNRPELTAEKFVPDPFGVEGGGRLYRTGDLVRWTADGSIEFLGRKDHQVKMRGFRIELGEIESDLAKHPGVKDAVVLIREDQPGDKRLVAYVVPAEGGRSEAAELRGLLKEALPEYMVPSAFVFIETLPLTPNGKVDRGALPEPEARPHPDQALVPPRNDLERRIVAIWKEVLQLDEVGVHDNFFDVGGHSLTLLRVHAKLRETNADVKIVDLFEYPTVSSLAAQLSAKAGEPDARRPVEQERREPRAAEEGIAIIGMAGRFPGARDLDEFWRNLRDSVESITFFSNEELESEGIPAALVRDDRFVKARGVVEGAELFDARFFGYNPREAEMIDPQQRVFLETAWAALERAGYDGERYRGQIGVYAGTSLNTYLLNAASPEQMTSGGGLPALIASDKDFLTTRVSYKLDLRGPSVDVQTACSTSLVAVHLACQSLRTHDCDMALAGGVSMGAQKSGYLYQEGGILSPDGHCRAFDRRAQGTVGGSGVGIVVLKRLSDALRDGDVIEAVIKGSAINNDGALKVGYTAPGVEGQAQVIAKAQASAGVKPETIGYIEAHGTGTALGDPIEIRALRQVFGGGDGRTGLCAIGSLKTNIGHLDAAAGVAGLIKTVLALQHRQIPPSLHFEEPNPKIDFVNSPFRVNAQLSEWTAEGTPRRAGVSSFGIGGTNAHVVLEEAPPAEPADPARRSFEVLVLSAKTPAALEEATRNLAAHLEMHPELDFADMAYTLQVGRRAFRHRRMVVCRDVTDALGALEVQEPGRLLDGQVDRTGHGVVFLFPGQGAQHANMGLGLYRTEEVFKTEVDRCAEHLRGDLGFDLRDVMYPAEGKEGEASGRLEETAVAQPGLFVVEYAMACLWKSLGVNPEAMLGHSVGEYVAACLAGVFSLEDALSVVAARGRLMQGMAKGSMLAVGLPEPEVVGLLQGALGLAAINGPSQCVVSGPDEEVQSLESRLSGRGVVCQRLRTSHAFHSAMMEPMLSAFRERVSTVERHAPKIPYISNLTGTWVTENEAVDAGYWVRHLRETVRFSEGLSELVKEGPRVLLEVGPGQTLCGLARRHSESGPERVVVASARHARESVPDEQVLVGALGRLWLAGVDVDWAALHAGAHRRRVALPTYPFQRQRYSIARSRAQPANASLSWAPTGKKADIADWFYRPTWRSTTLPVDGPGDLGGEGSGWLVFADACGLGIRLAQRLEEAGRRVISVTPGERFERSGGNAYAIRPGEAADYVALLGELKAEDAVPHRIAHLWGVTGRDEPAPPFEHSQDLGFYSLVFLAQALGSLGVDKEMGITVVTSGMQEVGWEGLASPEKATVLGPCRVIPQEYANVSCRSADIMTPESGVWRDDEIDRLLAECSDRLGEPVVAHRKNERWAQTFEAVRLEGRGGTTSRLREKGVYLITGGLGGIGLELAQFLVEAVHARVVLVGRTGLPAREEWEGWLSSHGEAESTSRRIRKVQALEASGGEVLVLSADVSDRRQMEDAFAGAEARFGEIHGVIHSAGVAPGGVVQLKTREMAERVLAPKVAGTLVLAALLKERHPDFVVLCSSLASILGVPGQVDYCAANAFQDAFARRQAGLGGHFVLSLNWDTWRQAGMAIEGEAPRAFREGPPEMASTGTGFSPRRGPRFSLEPWVGRSRSSSSPRWTSRPGSPSTAP